MKGSALQRRRFWRRAWATSVALLWTGCATPAPDPDGEPGTATLLSLGSMRRDQINCRGGDCADWYRIRLPARGDLFIDVAALEADVAATPYTLTLNSGRNRRLGDANDVGAGRKRMQWKGDAGHYLLAVAAPPRSRILRYELLARFEPEPPPPPPEPRFEQLTSEVLEVEGRPGDPRSVLIGRGQRDGIQPGLRGRMMQDEEEIATVEIVDVYPDGSRARIDGTLRAPITPDTWVEIDVPLDKGAGRGVRAAPDEPHGSAARPD
jgi:hypothetical protein